MAKMYNRLDNNLAAGNSGESQGKGGNDFVTEEVTLDGQSYVLTFNDEFSGTGGNWWDGLGSNGIWSTSFSPHEDDTRYISANNEEQYYVDADDPNLDSPFTVGNGALTINATALGAEDMAYADGQAYSSGLITTEMSFASEKGYIEIRADVPDEQGLWSSFWLLPADGDWSSEIDVFEIQGGNSDTVYTNIWDNGIPDSQAITGIDAGDGYHTYGIMWTDEKMQWYIDGQLVRETDQTVTEEMYLAISLAVGGFGGDVDETTDFSDGMSIDYVRVYELESDPNRNPAIDAGDFVSQDRHNGSDQADVVYGTRRSDTMFGETGADVMHGRKGDDQMFGGAEGDSLYGGKGDDVLYGGDGSDKLIGGAGDDARDLSAHLASYLDRAASGHGLAVRAA